MAFAQYDQFLTENKVITGTAESDIQMCWSTYFGCCKTLLDANNFQGYLKDYKWEYNLVDDKL